MKATRYLRTDEQEEAVRSLESAELHARAIYVDPYLWKWVFISLHNASQGFMVLALWNGNGLLSLTPKAAKKWLEAYESSHPFPCDRLDKFMNLYLKIKDQNNFSTIGSGPFIPKNTHDASFEKLNEIRNEFIHFTPKGWSLQLQGLPRISLDTLELIEFLGWGSTAIMWRTRALQIRAKRALSRLRRSLVKLESSYNL